MPDRVVAIAAKTTKVSHPRRIESPRVEIMEITPEIAGDWLALNIRNRPLTEETVMKYAREIEDGTFILNGETVKFTIDGYLVDGQHRLTGCVVCGKSFFSVVFWGAPVEAYETIDIGKRRKLSDALAIKGETSRLALSGVINLHWKWQHRQLIGKSMQPSVHAAMAHFEGHPRLRESARVGERSAVKARCPGSVLGVAHYLFAQSDSELATQFMDVLASGSNLKATDPIFRLRERFINNRERHILMSQGEQLALVIKTWNYWRAGAEPANIQWRYRGGELFPEVS